MNVKQETDEISVWLNTKIKDWIKNEREHDRIPLRYVKGIISPLWLSFELGTKEVKHEFEEDKMENIIELIEKENENMLPYPWKITYSFNSNVYEFRIIPLSGFCN